MQHQPSTLNGALNPPHSPESFHEAGSKGFLMTRTITNLYDGVALHLSSSCFSSVLIENIIGVEMLSVSCYSD